MTYTVSSGMLNSTIPYLSSHGNAVNQYPVTELVRARRARWFHFKWRVMPVACIRQFNFTFPAVVAVQYAATFLFCWGSMDASAYDICWTTIIPVTTVRTSILTKLSLFFLAALLVRLSPKRSRKEEPLAAGERSFSGQLAFLLPSWQCQSTDGIESTEDSHKKIFDYCWSTVLQARCRSCCPARSKHWTI